LNIGDVVEQLGIPASTIRYYEKKGLLPALDRCSGRRVFNQRSVMTLRFIQLSQAAGFSIAEIKDLLGQKIGDPADTGLWHPAIETKRAEIAQRISDLRQMDRILVELLNCRCQSVEQCMGTPVERPAWLQNKEQIHS